MSQAASRSAPLDADYGTCTHPRSARRGVCNRIAVGIYDIPDDYTPACRHANQPDVPRPRAALCRQHRGMVDHFLLADNMPGNAHATSCDVCRHKDGDWIGEMWVGWRMSTSEACIAAGVSYKTWYKHADTLGLTTRRRARDSRKKFLEFMMEKGMRGPGHNARTALVAATQLAREEGDMPAEKTDINVTALIGTVDVTRLSGNELADYMEKMAAEVRRVEAENRQPSPVNRALPSETRDESRVIDLPSSAVKTKVKAKR